MNAIKSNEAQMFTIEALIASMLIIISVLFVVSQIPSQVQKEVDDSEMQLRYYGEDVIEVLKESPSPDEDYDNLLQYYLSQGSDSELDDFLNKSFPNNVEYDVSLVYGEDKDVLFSHGNPGEDRIVVSEVIVSKDVSVGEVTGSIAGVKKVNKTFPAGSLIIPMDDDNQPDPDTSDDYIPLLKGMGLVYQIVNGTYSNGKPVPLWQLIEDPRGTSYTYFKSVVYINTSDNPRDPSVGIEPRWYAGGPYVIDANDLTDDIRDKILTASEENSTDHVNIHQLLEEFTYDISVKWVMAPKLAAYPPDDYQHPLPGPYYESKLDTTIADYYLHTGVPYIVINDTMIRNGILDNIDIVTIPHADLTPMPDDVARKIIDWVSNGGAIHAECLSIPTLDAKIETVDRDNHSWYGFIGVENTVTNNGPGESVIFVGNTSIFEWLDESSPDYFEPYQNPGAFLNVLSQSGNPSGVLLGSYGVSTYSAVPSFRYYQNNISKVNPGISIMAGAGEDEDSDEVDVPKMTYISAPFDKGMVTYLAGHDMSEGYYNNHGTHKLATPHKERLMFLSFFYPGFETISDYGVAELQITMWYK